MRKAIVIGIILSIAVLIAVVFYIYNTKMEGFEASNSLDRIKSAKAETLEGGKRYFVKGNDSPLGVNDSFATFLRNKIPGDDKNCPINFIVDFNQCSFLEMVWLMMRVTSLPWVAVLGATREMSFWLLLFFGCLFFRREARRVVASSCFLSV